MVVGDGRGAGALVDGQVQGQLARRFELGVDGGACHVVHADHLGRQVLVVDRRRGDDDPVAHPDRDVPRGPDDQAEPLHLTAGPYDGATFFPENHGPPFLGSAQLGATSWLPSNFVNASKSATRFNSEKSRGS